MKILMPKTSVTEPLKGFLKKNQILLSDGQQQKSVGNVKYSKLKHNGF